MARGRERPAVDHGRADGDARRHLVVEQAAAAGPQDRGQRLVKRFVPLPGMAEDGRGEIALQGRGDRLVGSCGGGGHAKRDRAESLLLKSVRTLQEPLARDAKQRAGKAETRFGRGMSPRQNPGARAGHGFESGSDPVQDGAGQQDLGRGGRESQPKALDKSLTVDPRGDDDETGLGAELAGAHDA